MNIIYGGSFNPPTLAHYEIVQTLLNNYPNAKVIIIPVGNTYQKDDLISFNHRFKMLELLFKDNNRVIISRVEETNFNGTFHTLNILNKQFNNLYLVVGSDNIININKWIEYEKLLKKYPLIIFRRNNDNVENIMKQYNKLNPKYEIINFNHNASSTLVRSNIEKNKKYLHNDIYNYILENNLYEVK